MRKLILILFVLSIFFNINTMANINSEDQWTVMLYMAVDKDRQDQAIKVINEIEEVGSGEGLNILAYIDGWGGYSWEYMGSGAPVRVQKNFTNNNSKVLHIQKDDTDDIKSSNIILDMQDYVSNGEAKNLKSFINLAQTNYPAEKYMVIIWGAGGGIEKTAWETDVSTFIPGYELGKAFQEAISGVSTSSSNKIDLVVFDSGFSATYELAEELAYNNVKAVVGAQGNISYEGFPYKEIFSGIKEYTSQNRVLNEQSIATDIVKKYLDKNSTEKTDDISALSFDVVTKFADIDDKIDILCKYIMADNKNYKKLHAAADRSLRYYYGSYSLDLVDFMKHIALEFEGNNISNLALGVVNSINSKKLIISEDNNENTGKSGISIYFPLYRVAERNNIPFEVVPFTNDKKDYKNMRFAKYNLWDEMIEQYYKYMQQAPEQETQVEHAPQLLTVSANVTTQSTNNTSQQLSTDNEESEQTSNTQSETVTETKTGGKYRWPTKSQRITSKYGWRVHPVYGTRKMHRGIDIGSGMGTAIFAPASGRITYAQATGSAGNMMIISHGNGKETAYMHCQRFVKRAGERVKRGEQVAMVGSTGASTGPHLHFETRENDQRLNPVPRLE